ncbi:MAG: hypothetical protein WDW36_002376 [Sanguina aurantia]
MSASTDGEAHLADVHTTLDANHTSNVDPESQLCGLRAEVDSLQKAITIINHLAAELDIHSAMDTVRNVAQELLDCDRVTNFLIFDRLQELRAKTELQFIIRVQFGQGIAGTVAQTGTTMNIPDAYAQPLFNSCVDQQTGYKTRNILCCAICDMTGKNVAVLQALNKCKGAQFSEADEKNLQLVGTHLGNLLVKAKLFEIAKREKARLAALYTCFRELSLADDVSDVLNAVTSALQEQVLGAELAVVFLVDGPRSELWTSYSTFGDEEHVANSIRFNIGEGIIGLAAQNREQRCVLEYVEDGDLSLKALQPLLGSSKVKTLLLQPVVVSGTDRCIAVIAAINKRELNGSTDICYENIYTDADRDAMALFTLEVADVLGDRSLELSLASAMSVVSTTGAHPRRSSTSALELQRGGSIEGSENLLTSQLMNLYSKASTEIRTPRDHSFSPSRPCPLHAFPSTQTHNSVGPRVYHTCLWDRLPVRDPPHPPDTSGRPTATPTPTPKTSPPSHKPSAAALTLFYPPALLRSWEFDYTRYQTEDLVKIAHDIFMLSGVVSVFRISAKTLRAFLSAVASQHNDCPYHNFNHVTGGAAAILGQLELLALLVAAVCHDVDHDGRSNSFHVNRQSEFARIYNDASVLENHHCALAFAILSRKECNIFESLTAEQQKSLRKSIIAAIMCTDMANHCELAQAMQKHSLFYDVAVEGDRMLMLKVLLHSADIGNSIRPFKVNQIMSGRVHLEFEAQAKLETELGLPVTMPIDASDPQMCARLEISFLDYIVLPLYQRLVEVLPSLSPRMDTLKRNKARYTAIAEGTEEESDLQVDPWVSAFSTLEGGSVPLRFAQPPQRLNQRSSAPPGLSLGAGVA